MSSAEIAMDHRRSRKSAASRAKAREAYRKMTNDFWYLCCDAIRRLSEMLARIPGSSAPLSYKLSSFFTNELEVLVTAIVRFSEYLSEHGQDTTDITSGIHITHIVEELTYLDIIHMINTDSDAFAEEDEEPCDEQWLGLPAGFDYCAAGYCSHYECYVKELESRGEPVIPTPTVRLTYSAPIPSVVCQSITIELDPHFAEVVTDPGPSWESCSSYTPTETPQFQARPITQPECIALRCDVNHTAPLGASETVTIMNKVIGVYSGPGGGKSEFVSRLRKQYRRVFDTDHCDSRTIIPSYSVLVSNRIDIINKCSVRVIHLPSRNTWLKRCRSKCGDRTQPEWYDSLLSSLQYPSVIVRSNKYLSDCVKFVYESRKYPDP